MTAIFYFLALFGLLAHSDSTRCFECQNVPYPRDCAKVRICNSDEYCSTEQIVTTSGTIIYNIGCLSKSRCSTTSGLLVGKRSANITGRSSSDLSTCIECCTGDYCNNQGCGTNTVPLGQRGPYCFNCHSVLDPKACTDVAVCEVNENCVLYSPPEFSGLPEVVYRSQCENKAACDVLSQAVSNYKCPASCCDTDFCNDQCGKQSSNNMTTPLPYTTTVHVPTQPPAHTTHQQPVVVTSQAPCKQDHYYDDLSGMCIKIDETRMRNHAEALKACEAIGDQLVTIDTHEKAVFVENMILRHSRRIAHEYDNYIPTKNLNEMTRSVAELNFVHSIGILSVITNRITNRTPPCVQTPAAVTSFCKLSDVSERKYYIGAFDKHDNSVFYWPNGHKMYYTNWGGGDEVASRQQPDGTDKNPQNCVIVYGLDYYQWHDDKCEHSSHFICEDRSTLNGNNVHHTGATSPAKPTHHSTTFHCNEHDGYMHLQGEGTHLCVHIVTHHAPWLIARASCKQAGGDLVILDTASKATLMRNQVSGHHTYSSQTGYWIGAKDFSNNNHFSWVNGQPVIHGDWQPGQPNHHDGGHDQDCAGMWRSSTKHFQWHDDFCDKNVGYICERN